MHKKTNQSVSVFLSSICRFHTHFSDSWEIHWHFKMPSMPWADLPEELIIPFGALFSREVQKRSSGTCLKRSGPFFLSVWYNALLRSRIMKMNNEYHFPLWFVELWLPYDSRLRNPSQPTAHCWKVNLFDLFLSAYCWDRSASSSMAHDMSPNYPDPKHRVFIAPVPEDGDPNPILSCN